VAPARLEDGMQHDGGGFRDLSVLQSAILQRAVEEAGQNVIVGQDGVRALSVAEQGGQQAHAVVKAGSILRGM